MKTNPTDCRWCGYPPDHVSHHGGGTGLGSVRPCTGYEERGCGPGEPCVCSLAGARPDPCACGHHHTRHGPMECAVSASCQEQSCGCPQYRDKPVPATRRLCDDGGTCHHECQAPECFRREGCAPLSETGARTWREFDAQSCTCGHGRKLHMPSGCVGLRGGQACQCERFNLVSVPKEPGPDCVRCFYPEWAHGENSPCEGFLASPEPPAAGDSERHGPYTPPILEAVRARHLGGSVGYPDLTMVHSIGPGLDGKGCVRPLPGQEEWKEDPVLMQALREVLSPPCARCGHAKVLHANRPLLGAPAGCRALVPGCVGARYCGCDTFQAEEATTPHRGGRRAMTVKDLVDELMQAPQDQVVFLRAADGRLARLESTEESVDIENIDAPGEQWVERMGEPTMGDDGLPVRQARVFVVDSTF